MSTLPAKTTARRDPFGFLRAILIGLVLGFMAVMIVPYVLPVRDAGGPSASRHPRVDGPASKRHGTKKARANDQAEGKLAQHGSPPSEGAGRIDPDTGRPADGGTADEAKARPQNEDGQPQLPVPPETANDGTKSEPILIPANNLKYPKPFSEGIIDTALQPVLSFKIGDSDAAAIKEVIAFLSKGDGDGAAGAVKKISDAAAKTFAEWRRVRASNANLGEIMAFAKAHPLFPEPAQDAAIERSLFLSDASSADILKFYANRNPLTGAGQASLGAALAETGEHERGLELIRFVWSRYSLDAAVQERFLSRFGALLNGDDQVRRKLLLAVRLNQQEDAGKLRASVSNKRAFGGIARFGVKRGRGVFSRGHRGKMGKGVGRAWRRGSEIQTRVLRKEAALSGKAHAFPVAALFEPVTVKKAPPPNDDTASQGEGGDKSKNGSKPADSTPAEKQGTGGAQSEKPQPNAEKPAAANSKPAQKTLQSKAAENAFKLTRELTDGPLTLLVKLKSLRREGADDDLWSLLRSIEPDKADLADPDRWWDFRRNEIRRALSGDHPKTAYAIAKAHGPLEAENRSEAEFLAGWIALRFLKDANRAAAHFEAARSSKGTPRDQARAAYWLGRTKLELGSAKEADAFFGEAASRFYTFYGTLAWQALRKGTACEFRAPPQPTKEDIDSFVNEDAFKAIIIAKQLDLQPLLSTLFLEIARQIHDPGQMTLLLELAERIAPANIGVRAARIALGRGFAVEAYAFPTLLPKFDPASGNGKIEPALLNALTRQESEFRTASVSPVGARGLMQLMPQTAKIVAAANKIKYDLPRLVSDPSYNVTLGSAFLAQLVSGYGGSYVLSLAAYNAGPGRVIQWIKDFGDPRDKSIDPIDWIERIPFTETRNYVQRVLESTQLYRCRFESGAGKFQIVEDLHRGRPGIIPNFADIDGPAEMDQSP